MENQLEVRDHRPLQQGLRLDDFNSVINISSVRDHRPLQQGLRRFLDNINSCTTKKYETIFHYNKD